MANSLLQMRGIDKRFPGVHALKNVDFSVQRGEVVALAGENGAGKSTLMKILGGIYQPDSGEMFIDGQMVTFPDVTSSIEQGIGFIHQELNVLDNLSVAANIFLGREPLVSRRVPLLSKRRIRVQCQPFLDQLGLDVSPDTLLKDLSIAQQQMVEIAKAISLDARILIMDEPTSSLTVTETERLFEIIARLKADGVSIIYITHRLKEIERCADRVVGLRDGANSGELSHEKITHDHMVQLMVGREIKGNYVPPSQPPVPNFLKVDGLKTRRWPEESLTFEAARGEILAITGLVGAGRTELVAAIAGVEPALEGNVTLDGRSISIHSAAEAIKHGIYLAPEDRKKSGLIVELSVRANVTLPDLKRFTQVGLIRKRSETTAAQAACETLNVKTASVETAVQNLSGGNQQKVVLAKWLAMDPKVMIFDEPTRGVDVGARSEIYKIMRSLADEGLLILMVSSDMEEVINVSDRVMVMCEGRLTGVLERKELTEEQIMNLAVNRTDR